MKRVKLQKVEIGDSLPPDNTTVFFRAWLTQKDCVWTIGRRFTPRDKRKILWQDYSMGLMLEDSQVVEWSLVMECAEEAKTETDSGDCHALDGNAAEDRYCPRCGAALFDDQEPGLCETCKGEAQRGAHDTPQWMEQNILNQEVAPVANYSTSEPWEQVFEAESAKMGLRQGVYSPSAISCMKETFRRGYIHGQNVKADTPR